MADRQVGLWLIGAFGGVGSTVALGAAALQRGLIERIGLVTELDVFRGLALNDPADFVLGGHDIRHSDFATGAAAVGRGALPASLIDAVRPKLAEWSANVRPGALVNSDPVSASLADRSDVPRAETVRAMIDRVQADLRSFAERNRLERMVVINVASTEPPAASHPAQLDLGRLDRAIAENEAIALPVSAWYAYAAIDASFPYVNFTPSTGANLPALIALAEQRGGPIAGSDGKTGETLVKTALAPMFFQRNLRVLSWVSHNILGNRDGQVLSDPTNRASKLRSKDQVVANILGYAPQSLTSIEYIESLDDWKTAWDHIHFQGFLGVKMSMQFTWQGCDSALAAPLVLDLARLALAAQRFGEKGVLDHLGVFFKSPMGSSAEHALFRQFARLEEYALADRGRA